jgi:FkbM family methyltransferase
MTLKEAPLSPRAYLGARALRMIPYGTRGKARLARLLLGRALDQQDRLTRCRDGLFVVPNLRGNIGFHMLIDGVYEPDEVDFVVQRLRPGGCFLDVGANIGLFSVAASNRVGPSGRVIAVEASPKIHPYLERNVELNQATNVTLVNKAAADQACTLAFYDAPTANFGMGTRTNLFGIKPVHVAGERLDAILEDARVVTVDVMKIDVEGHEAAVLRGASRLLGGPSPPLIVFEFCDWAEEKAEGARKGDAQRILRDAGFQVWHLRDFLRGEAPLHDVVTAGFLTLVARRELTR